MTSRPLSPVDERDARLYLHLAERFGWTPEQIGTIDLSTRAAMAKVLNLLPRDDAPTEDDKQPAYDAPAEPEGLADWERELLAKQGSYSTPATPVTEVRAYLDGQKIYDAMQPHAQRYRRNNGGLV